MKGENMISVCLKGEIFLFFNICIFWFSPFNEHMAYAEFLFCFAFLLHFFIWGSQGMHMPRLVCGVRRLFSSFHRWLFPSVMWVSGIEVRNQAWKKVPLPSESSLAGRGRGRGIISLRPTLTTQQDTVYKNIYAEVICILI